MIEPLAAQNINVTTCAMCDVLGPPQLVCAFQRYDVYRLVESLCPPFIDCIPVAVSFWTFREEFRVILVTGIVVSSTSLGLTKLETQILQVSKALWSDSKCQEL